MSGPSIVTVHSIAALPQVGDFHERSWLRFPFRRHPRVFAAFNAFDLCARVKGWTISSYIDETWFHRLFERRVCRPAT
ncbi:hypothetical protein MPC4_470007 [Methylocella tundrae]|uniref:Uncharacterized protein n=1 Tax=Methylocella tundrae TaxID=227605 RepID=A0A8B6M9J7_METTU|nr:hypothetical protein MPC4_470007 [Methylocella tundrae]